VIYGHNGSGKTTLLHILANILNGDYDRFAFLDFKSILLEFDNGRTVRLARTTDQDDITGAVDYLITVDDGESTEILSVQEIESQEPTLTTPFTLDIECTSEEYKSSKALLPTVYFPAFRTVIEAWKSVRKNYSARTTEQATSFIRRWLLPFIPRVDYPSLSQVEQGLANSSATLSGRGKVDRYLECVNSFLEGKKLVVNLQGEELHLPPVDLKFDDGTRSGLGALSSGERQIVTLMYAATEVNSYKVLLVDEPEISLHVRWQRLLLSKMATLSQYQQIIACTHSPVIRADYPDMRLVLAPTSAEDEEIPYDR
jgi:predicted ATP-binding protein involved in virulence